MMSETVKLVVTSLPAYLTVGIVLWVTLGNRKLGIAQAKQNQQENKAIQTTVNAAVSKLGDVHDQINSKMDKLLEVTAESSEAKGVLAEKTRAEGIAEERKAKK
jgi:hypothetical protein